MSAARAVSAAARLAASAASSTSVAAVAADCFASSAACKPVMVPIAWVPVWLPRCTAAASPATRSAASPATTAVRAAVSAVTATCKAVSAAGTVDHLQVDRVLQGLVGRVPRSSLGCELRIGGRGCRRLLRANHGRQSSELPRQVGVPVDPQRCLGRQRIGASSSLPIQRGSQGRISVGAVLRFRGKAGGELGNLHAQVRTGRTLHALRAGRLHPNVRRGRLLHHHDPVGHRVTSALTVT